MSKLESRTERTIPRKENRPYRVDSAGLVLALFVLGIWPGTALAQQTCTFTQITDSTGSNFEPSINADGTRIAFRSRSDLTGGNPDLNDEIFLFDATSGFTQITDSTGGFNSSPSINSDGTRIAFESQNDLTGDNLDRNTEIFLFDATTGLTQITHSTGGFNFSPSVNSDGTRIAFESNHNLDDFDPTDNNPDLNPEIFLFDTTTGLTQQITGSFGGGNRDPSINSDGTRIAFVSTSDLTGGNSDGNEEIFLDIDLFDTTTGLTPITNSEGGANLDPSINSDGTRIAFRSDRNLTGGNLDFNFEIFLFDVTTGLTRITDSTGGLNSTPSINSDGTRIAFASSSDLTGENPGVTSFALLV